MYPAYYFKYNKTHRTRRKRNNNNYNTLGKKTSIKTPDIKKSWTYSYNVLGELTKQTDAKGNETTYTYDKLGRLTSRTDPAGTSTWQYDTSPHGIGKLATINGTSNNELQSQKKRTSKLQKNLQLRPTLKTQKHNNKHKRTKLHKNNPIQQKRKNTQHNLPRRRKSSKPLQRPRIPRQKNKRSRNNLLATKQHKRRRTNNKLHRLEAFLIVLITVDGLIFKALAVSLTPLLSLLFQIFFHIP